MLPSRLKAPHEMGAGPAPYRHLVCSRKWRCACLKGEGQPGRQLFEGQLGRIARFSQLFEGQLGRIARFSQAIRGKGGEVAKPRPAGSILWVFGTNASRQAAALGPTYCGRHESVARPHRASLWHGACSNPSPAVQLDCAQPLPHTIGCRGVVTSIIPAQHTPHSDMPSPWR
eukprot:121575-Chlamydomonas_euryale.AAC.2